jgi:chromosome segregation ATPase
VKDLSEERYYNLSYSHDKIDELLKKVDLGEILTKDQYRQLIKEIGLDNISVFDLNYYNLKNIPTIPVRVSELFNDSNYDTIPNVTRQIEELYQLLEDEVTRIDGKIGQMNILDIQEVLADLEEVDIRIMELNEQIDISNNAIFSVERIVDSINKRTADLILDMHNISSTQEDELLKITRVQSILNIHSEDIHNLLFLIESLQDKFNNKSEEIKVLEEKINTFKYFDDSFNTAVNELKTGLDTLDVYYDKVHADIQILNKNIADYNKQSMDRFDALNIRFDDLDARFESLEEEALNLISDSVHELVEKVADLEENTYVNIQNTLLRYEGELENLEDSIDAMQEQTSDIVDNRLSVVNTKISALDLAIKDNTYSIQNHYTEQEKQMQALQEEMQDKIPTKLSELENDLDFASSLDLTKHVVLTDTEFNSLSDEEKESTDTLHIVMDTDQRHVRNWLKNILRK